jgi:hypothetical protein
LILPPRPLELPSILTIPVWSSPVEQSYLTTGTSTGDDGQTTTHHGYNVTTIIIEVTFPESEPPFLPTLNAIY